MESSDFLKPSNLMGRGRERWEIWECNLSDLTKSWETRQLQKLHWIKKALWLNAGFFGFISALGLLVVAFIWKCCRSLQGFLKTGKKAQIFSCCKLAVKLQELSFCSSGRQHPWYRNLVWSLLENSCITQTVVVKAIGFQVLPVY